MNRQLGKKALAMVTGAALSISLLQPLGAAADGHDVGKRYADIDQGSEFYEAIDSMYYKGVMSGYRTGMNFLDPVEIKPLQSVTRAQASKMFVNITGMFPATVYDNSFEDINDGHWADTYVTLLSRKGIISGKENGQFDPEEGLSRAQVAKMVVKSFDLPVTDGETSFNDVPEDSWFAPYVKSLLNAGITTGRTEETYDPYGKVTRYQLAAFLDRAFDMLSVEDMNDRQTLMLAKETLTKLDDRTAYQRQKADSTEELPAYETFRGEVAHLVTEDYEPTLIERYEASCVNCGMPLYQGYFFPEKYIDFEVKNDETIIFTSGTTDSAFNKKVDLRYVDGNWQLNDYTPNAGETPPFTVDFEKAANFIEYMYEGEAFDRIFYLDQRPDLYRFYHEENGIETIFIINKNTGETSIEQ